MKVEVLFQDEDHLRRDASEQELRAIARKYLSELLARLAKEYPDFRIELAGTGSKYRESRFNGCTDGH